MKHEYCFGCVHLKTVSWGKGKAAHICASPNSKWPHRVIGNPGAAEIIRMDKEIKPAWCPEKGKNNEQER